MTEPTRIYDGQPIRPPIAEEVWYEVRCPRCGWHITDLTAGSKCRKECPKCKRTVIRSIPQKEAA